MNVQKNICNNPKLDLVNTNAFIKFGEILSICSQDIERGGIMTDGFTDEQNETKSNIAPLFQRGAINTCKYFLIVSQY